MYISKILKGYFVFVMMIAVGAVVNSSNLATGFLASVLNADEKRVEVKEALVAGDETNSEAKIATFALTNEAANAYAEPGKKGAILMDVKIGGTSSDLELSYLKFRIAGVESDKVEKIYLFEGEKLLGEAEGVDGNFEIRGLRIGLSAGKEQTYQVKVDLSPQLHSGERLRMDLEKSAGTFIKGPYLSIVEVQ